MFGRSAVLLCVFVMFNCLFGLLIVCIYICLFKYIVPYTNTNTNTLFSIKHYNNVYSHKTMHIYNEDIDENVVYREQKVYLTK